MKPLETYEAHQQRIKYVNKQHQSVDIFMLFLFTGLAAFMVFLSTGCNDKDNKVDLGPINELAAQIQALQTQLNTYTGTNDLEISYLKATILALQTQQSILESAIVNSQGDITGQQAVLESIEASQAVVLSNLAILNNYTHIVGYLDPCGNHATQYDEVLIKLSTGKYLAHFSHGSLQFLTELAEDVQYQTTDGTFCSFRIVNGNVVY